MNTQQTENIKDSINMCKMRLKTILPHLTPEKTVLNETFNKLLIEKAVLRDKLTHKSIPFFKRMLKRTGLAKKELICDYFK